MFSVTEWLSREVAPGRTIRLWFDSQGDYLHTLLLDAARWP